MSKVYAGWLVACLMVLAPVCAFAADEKKDDATGTWKWQMKRQNGDAVDVTMKLKQDGEKLTGTVSGRDNAQTEIADGSVKDGTVSFKVTRKRNDQEFTSTYSGKIAGDTITGKISSTVNGEARSRDWEAKRAKE